MQPSPKDQPGRANLGIWQEAARYPCLHSHIRAWICIMLNAIVPILTRIIDDSYICYNQDKDFIDYKSICYKQ